MFIIDLLTILLIVQNKKTVIENAFYIDWRTVLPPEYNCEGEDHVSFVLMAIVYYFYFARWVFISKE